MRYRKLAFLIRCSEITTETLPNIEVNFEHGGMELIFLDNFAFFYSRENIFHFHLYTLNEK